jgi:hypothetical protein
MSTATSFHSRVIHILISNGFNSVNNRYFFRNLKQVMLENLSGGVFGYTFIASASLIFQWNCGRCFYNEVEMSEEQLLEKVREFAKEESVKEPVDEE